MKKLALLASLICTFGYINIAFADDEYGDEAIIDPSYMVMETWSQPDFEEPVVEAQESRQEDRGVASQVSTDVQGLEHHPWEYLEVQTTIPHTEAMSKAWYERKVLREMKREEQEADGY